MKTIQKNANAIITGLKIGGFGIFIGWVTLISITAFQALEAALILNLP